MSRTRFLVLIPAVAALVFAGSWTAFSQSQGLLTHKALSLDMAQAIAHGAIEQCRADHYMVSVTVIDDGGMLKAFFHDDGAGPHHRLQPPQGLLPL